MQGIGKGRKGRIMNKKTERSLNALCNPAMEGDIIIMDDASEWKIKRGLINWEIHPPIDSSLPVFQCYAQTDLLRMLNHINSERGI